MKTKTRVSAFIPILFVCIFAPSNNSLAWRPSGGEEQQLFNQYVTEQLKFIPQTPVRNRWGRIVGYRGPTYEQQWKWEHDRQMRQAQTASNTRDGVIQNSTKEVQKIQRSLQKDATIRDLERKKANAQARVNLAQSLRPDGPISSEVQERLNERRNAGGRLDANGDGVISEGERKAALASRVSMQQTQYRNEKKLDRDGNNDISKAESTRGLVQVAGQSSLDHTQMLREAQRDKSWKDTGIGKGAYVDAHGRVQSKASLNNPRAMGNQLTRATQNANVMKYARDNDPMTLAKLSNGRPLPAQTHRHASITTNGTWGRTRTWNRSFEAAGAANRSTAQLQSQMRNPQTSGANNQFFNRMQTSTAGFQNINRSAQQQVANAQRTQNSTTGFRSAQTEAQRQLANIKK
jgi:hypothetical protein